MTISEIVAVLTAERDRIERAIQALGGGAKRRGRPPKNPANAGADAGASAPSGLTRKRKSRTAAQRKAHSERMKAFWAARRKKKQ